MGDKCKAAKAAFRAAGDVRGQVICPPNVSSSSRHQFQKKISDQWMKRTSDHWRTITYKSLHEICNRKDKNNLPLATRTREQMNQQIEKPKQVKIPKLCLSHFHPKVVEKYAQKIPKAITEAEAESLGIYSKNGGSLYSMADTILDQKGRRLVLLLPIYPLHKAISDANQAQKSKRMTAEIERVTSKRITSVFERRISSDLLPIQSNAGTSRSSGEKRKRVKPTYEELEAENNRLHRRVKKLEGDLLTEKNNYSDLLRQFSFLEECIRHQKEDIDKKIDKAVKQKLEEKLDEEMISRGDDV